MWESSTDSIRRSAGSRAGLGLLALAPIIEDDNKTKEDIEAEEEARRNGEGFGAMVGAGVLVYDYLASQNEPQATEEDEDADQGFTMHM